MEAELRIRKRVAEGIVILELEGDLSRNSEETLLSLYEWEQGLEQGASYLILNLAGVSYINSLGIAVLIRIVRSLSRKGCQTFACGVTPHYQKLFRMVGLTDYLMIFPDEYSIRSRIEQLR
ncbi:STAS domain-containing protein [Paenibacillus thermoaerophilus]|uniref:Anti-sigma factor antagonist n=1 Tax=Paenibacillus thermoaerophilus TaxID=1215385 RepID=A0ABW2V4A7_9BACL|nr:STAS domain-containing protein [Paenibacillus thermoaerophilus]TMV13905.1 STAS domain-containing protein [Paenibacillus thermoaerophilus]